ncbi:hypothetical protein GF337_19165 [candidate division KSB1 bacterium]|nr:hypothetical protein [candidate division KSB1 bacterium]
MSDNKLTQLIDEMKHELSGFISTDVVEVESGISVAGGSISPDFDSDVASKKYAEVLKAHQKAAQALGGKKTVGETEDILITTTMAYLILIPFPDGKYYHGLAISRDGNLAFARLVMKKYQPLFIKALSSS